MSKNKVILLLGTNLGNKNNNLNVATTHIVKEVGSVIRLSNILENQAEGFTSSNTFLNQMIEVETELSPINLLKVIKIIEQEMGRVYHQPLPNEQYVDRLIDIDILTYNNIVYKSEMLKIPHHQLNTRKFILDLKFI